MPVEFLSDVEAGAYGRFGGAPSRVFFLDDADRVLVDRRRGAYNRLGFALQLTTVRSLGLFLPDPLEVPPVVVEYLGGQLAVADLSWVSRYMERRSTRFEHADEIKRVFGLRDFAAAEEDLERWVDARAWTTGDGPRAIFDDAIGWLFDPERAVARRHDAGPAGGAGQGRRDRARVGHAVGAAECAAGTVARAAVGRRGRSSSV